jgi:hypothetical protein
MPRIVECVQSMGARVNIMHDVSILYMESKQKSCTERADHALLKTSER